MHGYTVGNDQPGGNGTGTEMLSMVVNIGVAVKTYCHNCLPSHLMPGNGSATPPLNILKSEIGRNAWTYPLQLRHQLLPDSLLQLLTFLAPHKSRCGLDLAFAQVLPVHLFACNSTVD
jgi:hypothetical protein